MNKLNVVILVCLIFNSCSFFSSKILIDFKHTQVEFITKDFKHSFITSDGYRFPYDLQIDSLSNNKYVFAKVFYHEYCENCCNYYEGEIDITNNKINLIIDYLPNNQNFYSKGPEITYNGVCTSMYTFKLKKNDITLNSQYKVTILDLEYVFPW